MTFLLVSCSSPPLTPQTKEIYLLANELKSLSNHISHTEATKLSLEIYRQVERLKKKFKRTTSPWYHNFLVNMGWKKQGLCYHWADALYRHFIHSQYPSFEFHLMGANIGEYWTEHNSFVVVALGADIHNALIIDPWRNLNILYYSKVKDDQSYNWIHRPSRGCLKK